MPEVTWNLNILAELKSQLDERAKRNAERYLSHSKNYGVEGVLEPNHGFSEDEVLELEQYYLVQLAMRICNGALETDYDDQYVIYTGVYEL